ncbi:MAG: hypothetical protein LBR12_04110, partial [Opitutaceae bacterium]|nr:hypothetical protein [Opitutaceae bacterium]
MKAGGARLAGEAREALRRRFLGLGFDTARFARADGAGAAARRLREWLAAGCHADMHWLERNADRRASADAVVSGARTVVVFGVSYG